ncbi:MAG: 5-histidylcysteine sulfoxide synthase [Rickettsiales bacterium]|nr:5-histidylcysteine sulfoxide synthase [Rickettsiales bacterium]
MKLVQKIMPEDMEPSFWTGLQPVHGVCPGVTPDGVIHALPQVSLTASRTEILDYFNNGWTMTEVLFSGLRDDAAYVRRPYHQLRHPMIFYYAHPVSLYINKLRVAGVLDGPLNAEYEALFETGVDEMRWDDLHEGAQHIWPSVVEVREYRRQAYRLLVNLIKTHPLLEPQHLPITQQSPMWALVMGFEHERIHLETSSVLIRELPIEMVQRPEAWPAYRFSNAPSAMPHNAMRDVSAQTVTLGKPDAWPSFGWDNEYGAEAREVAAFSASECLISNAEFLEFMKSGGYSQQKYWSPMGWEWRRFRNVMKPAFWEKNGPTGSHLYKLRTVFEVIDMQPDWPVNVNYYEAKAYCAWLSERSGGATFRLLKESEHHALRDGGEGRANHSLHYDAESPVRDMPANNNGFYDVFGNVWQWCEDSFHPLQGFKTHPYYDDFSTPCYDGEHQMILGGSFISTGEEANAFARFHFRPHFAQHAGFRVVRESEHHAPAAQWSRAGWLATAQYQAAVGKFIAQQLIPFLQGKTVLDVGAGTGDIWRHALENDVSPKQLILVDPYVQPSADVLAMEQVSYYKSTLAEVPQSKSADVFFFKQSFHLMYAQMGEALFELIGTRQMISFSMKSCAGWPFSAQMQARFAPSVLPMVELAATHGKSLIHKSTLRYAVQLSREEWQHMLKLRFMSCMADCSEAEIAQEIQWASDNLPLQVAFDDVLECHVFE